ncbi:hypothetical protein SDJN02_25031, partial [Cucurbita argyrosperma subsp. argyrosperma]
AKRSSEPLPPAYSDASRLGPTGIIIYPSRTHTLFFRTFSHKNRSAPSKVSSLLNARYRNQTLDNYQAIGGRESRIERSLSPDPGDEKYSRLFRFRSLLWRTSENKAAALDEVITWAKEKQLVLLGFSNLLGILDGPVHMEMEDIDGDDKVEVKESNSGCYFQHST